ncbi:hypothetical protein LSAT2_026769 [Lamellibrachia satsuma]|nr:hypothetical protein LSAT2_026769 [Lamellibrachia satsuma]
MIMRFYLQESTLLLTTLLLTTLLLYTIPSFITYTSWLQGYQAVFHYVGVCMYPLMRTAQPASVWVTVLITVNRYIAVYLPYKASQLYTFLKAKKHLAFVLLFAVLYNIPIFTLFRVVYETSDNGTTYTAVVYETSDNCTTYTAVVYETSDNGTTYTAVTNKKKLGSEKLYHIILDNILYFIFLLVLPIIILVVLNIRLIKALKAFRRKRMEIQSLRQQQDNSVTLVHIIVVIVVIV